MDVKDKKYLIVGIARSGVAAAELLESRGAHAVLNDVQPEGKLGRFAAGYQRFEHYLGGHETAYLDGCSGVIISPGVPLDNPLLVAARERGLAMLGEVELAWRFCCGSVVGITGTNGKTTTTMLAAKLLRDGGLPAVACGNMGHPLSRAVLEAGDSERVYVCELSSFQLEALGDFRPHIATILNLTPDHLDRYPDLTAYYAAKQNIFRHQRSDDFVIVNTDAPAAAAASADTAGRKIYIGAAAGAHPLAVFPHEGGLCWQSGGPRENLLPVTEIGIPGPHNLENAMVGAAVALAYGLPASSVAASLRAFRGVEHRLEPVATIGDVTFVNDSKATNVDSVVKSLQSYRQPIVWIGGGRDKGGDFSVLPPLVQMHVRSVVVVGELSDTLAAVLGDSAPVARAADMMDAVRQAAAAAEPGDVVLLSPGGTSFDLFGDFEERGRVFKQCVRRLGEEQL